MGWILAFGTTVALGFFFWWLCHSKQDKENRINPNAILDGGAYTNASGTERNETEEDQMRNVKINFTFEKIKFTPIEGSNYFYHLAQLEKTCKIVTEMYSDLFHVENDTRQKADRTEKFVHMRKLQIFE